MNHIAPGAEPLIREIPLSRLALAPENVRKTPPDPRADAELKASIAALGLLENLVVRADEPGEDGTDRYAVVAGGRRLKALRALAEDGATDADCPVPCLVKTGDAEPGEISLAENVVRIAMHPADQVVAFTRLADVGQSVSSIAARFGLTERLVEQRLRLGNAAPELLDAYRADGIDLEVLKAFAVTADRERQMAVWEQVSGQGYRPSAWQVKRLLTEERVPGATAVARFVGVEAYEAAGGPVMRDLFARDDESGVWFEDPVLLAKLATDKLQAAADELATRWKWAVAMVEVEWSDTARYGRIEPQPGTPTDEEQAEIEKLEARQAKLAETADEDWTEELLAEAESIETRLDEIEGAVEARAVFRREDFEIAGCIVTVAQDGAMQLIQGLVKPEDMPKPAESDDAGPVAGNGHDPEAVILVFSMAGGTGRSYHADLSCGNTERRIHYLLEPGWRADQAIQGLGRTHRTHQASAPLFRPVTTDVKGERRFIATIARRLDSLGAITRGQRDSQTAMGGSDAALFRESDNLESAYAKAALRQFYNALWRGRIEGWNAERFQESTGLKIVHEGGLKDDLPPMPKFLNRLLALPIAEQNQLFAELEERIAANIEQAIEAGSYEVGVETVTADSLAVAGRETLYEHPGTGAATELVEIVRRDRLEPTGAETALAIGTRDPGRDGEPRLVFNTRSQRAAVVLPAPARMFDDGGVQERVRLLRPATREAMAKAEFDASNWRKADPGHWRMLWGHEIGELPSHRESRFWLASGLLLPVWDRLPTENMRVRRLTSDDGIALIGRVLDAEQVRAVRASFGLDGGPAMTGPEAFNAVMERGNALALANGWRLARRRLMGSNRVEIEGPADTDLPALRRMGCTVEIVSFRARIFAPNATAMERILDRWPLAA